MNEEELANHRLAIKLLEKDLNFAQAAAAKEEVVDEEDNK
jgi:hypothetical protein